MRLLLSSPDRVSKLTLRRAWPHAMPDAQHGDPVVPSGSPRTPNEPRRRLVEGRIGLLSEPGGDERARTADLLVANEALSQLSYIPLRAIN